ncbi:MAG: DNA methyltransferase [Chloroflexota bacterium]
MRIRIGNRLRRDLGDIEPLARSIAEIGLLQPVVVSEDGTLIAGHRRLMAWRMLGRPEEEIPVTVVPLKEIAMGEFAENTIRKDFNPSEAWSIYQAIKPLEEAAAKDRQGTRTDLQPRAAFAPSDVGKSRSKAAALTGYSYTTLERAGEIVQAADANEKYRPFVEEMDGTGRVNTAYRRFCQQRLLDDEEQQCRQGEMTSGMVGSGKRIHYQQDGVTLVLGDCREMSELDDETVDLVVTDPPFSVGVNYGGDVNDNMEPEEYAAWTREWVQECLRVLKPGGQIFAIMPLKWAPWWQWDLRDLWREHRGHLLAWVKTMAHLHHEKTWIRAWEPVLWLAKDGVPDVFKRSYRFEDDRDWFIGTNAITEAESLPLIKLHPTPRPNWFYQRVILRCSEPGMVVLDPFLGSGTGACVARKLGRRFIGYDIEERYVHLAAKRVFGMNAPEGDHESRADEARGD